MMGLGAGGRGGGWMGVNNGAARIATARSSEDSPARALARLSPAASICSWDASTPRLFRCSATFSARRRDKARLCASDPELLAEPCSQARAVLPARMGAIALSRNAMCSDLGVSTSITEGATGTVIHL